MEAFQRIDQVFLTHSHLDQVACLPFVVDTVGSLRQHPLTVARHTGSSGHFAGSPIQLESVVWLSLASTLNEALWEAVNKIENLRYLIIETAFPDQKRSLGRVKSKHLCPQWLRAELGKLKGPAEVFVTHLKPSQRARIIDEVEMLSGNYSSRGIGAGQVAAVLAGCLGFSPIPERL